MMEGESIGKERHFFKMAERECYRSIGLWTNNHDMYDYDYYYADNNNNNNNNNNMINNKNNNNNNNNNVNKTNLNYFEKRIKANSKHNNETVSFSSIINKNNGYLNNNNNNNKNKNIFNNNNNNNIFNNNKFNNNNNNAYNNNNYTTFRDDNITKKDDTGYPSLKNYQSGVRDLSTTIFKNDQLFCRGFFDSWDGCWNTTLAGQRAYVTCPARTGFDVNLFAYIDCKQNGNWMTHPRTNRTWANYTTCIHEKDFEIDAQIVLTYVIGYSVSTFCLLISLVIFFNYRRQLNCDRIKLHKNLFSSYIINSLFWLIYYYANKYHEDMTSSRWCKMLHVGTQFSVASNYFWMFCEGLYLHTIIVVGFVKAGGKLLISCYIIGWGIPFILTIIYTIVMSQMSKEDKSCWTDVTIYSYIIAAPIILTLLANGFFLFNIIRILVMKLRAVNSQDYCQAKKAFKATLILIPLLGVQFILFPISPARDSSFFIVYQFTLAIVSSFQGFLIAIFYCFLTGEVTQIIKRRLMSRRRSTVGSRTFAFGLLKSDSNRRRSSTVVNNNNNNHNKSHVTSVVTKTADFKLAILDDRAAISLNKDNDTCDNFNDDKNDKDDVYNDNNNIIIIINDNNDIYKNDNDIIINDKNDIHNNNNNNNETMSSDNYVNNLEQSVNV